MSAAQDALAEVEASLAELAPIHEGLRDYAALNLQPPTKDIINAAVLRYDQRRDALLAAKAALDALINDGHPEIPVSAIPEAAYADLQINQSTITAALGKFAPDTSAPTLGLSAGTPESKGSTSGKKPK